MMIGPMPLQQQAGTSLPAAKTSTEMAQMAFEDEAVMPHQHKGRAALGTPIPAVHQSGAQSQMAALSSSSSLQTMKSAEKPQSHVGSIDDIPTGELDIEASQLRSDGRQVIRLSDLSTKHQSCQPCQQQICHGSDQALIDMDGDMQFDRP